MMMNTDNAMTQSSQTTLVQRMLFVIMMFSFISVGFTADNANDQNTHDAIDGPKNPFEDYANGDPCDETRTGSPVILQNREFLWTDTDVLIPGRNPLQLTRTYRSFDSREGYFGKGWSTECEKVLVRAINYGMINDQGAAEARFEYIYRLSNGRSYTFQETTSGEFATPAGLPGYSLVVNSDDTASLKMIDGSSELYNSTGQLVANVDRNGNRINYSYQDGALTKMSDAHGRFLDFQFDSTGHVSSVVDHTEREWQYIYNADGTLASVTDPSGGVRQYEYEIGFRAADAQPYPLLNRIIDETERTIISVVYSENGQVSSYTVGEDTFTYTERSGIIYKTDTTRSQWSYKLDEHGHLTEFMPPLNQGAAYLSEYNDDGKLLKYTDLFGTEYTNDYDSLGRLVASTSLDGTNEFAYQGNTTWLTSTTSPSGRVNTLDYDATGRLIARTDAAGNATRFAWKDNGDLTSITDAMGNVYTVTMSEAGYPVGTTDALGRSVAFAFDARGNVISVTNTDGTNRAIRYDILNRPIGTSNESGATTTTSYDAAGRVLSVIDAEGFATTFAYDVHGRLLSETQPDGFSQTYTYRTDNLLETVTDSRGRINTYQYDRNKRITSISISGDLPTGGRDSRNYRYDIEGRITSITSAGPPISYKYDALGRVIEEKQGQSVVGFSYNADGELLNSTHGMDVVGYSYDARGLLASVTTLQGKHQFAYDAVGRKVQHIRPAGQTSTASYDAVGRMLSLDHSQLSGESFQYEWDERDRLVQLTTVLNGATTYAYDGISQLTSALASESSAYVYDSRYNRVGNGQVYDAFNKLLEDNESRYSYDLAGNLTSRINKLTGNETVMKYNSTDRLTQIDEISGGQTTQVASYVYDGLGRRSSKTVNREFTQFQWSGDALIGEVDGRGIEASRRYRYGTDWSPLEFANTDSSYQVSSNHLMTPTGLVDELGNLAWSQNRGPFDEMEVDTTAGANSVDFHIGLPGQYRDTETNLNYNNQRYYDPKVGRYLSSDPLGLAGGINQYRYALNNPLGAIDPRGEIAFVPLIFIAIEVAAAAYSAYEIYQVYKDPCSTGTDYIWPVVGLASSAVGGALTVKSIRGASKAVPSIRNILKEPFVQTQVRANGSVQQLVNSRMLVVSENHIGDITRVLASHNGRRNLFNPSYWKHVLPHRHIYTVGNTPVRLNANWRKTFQKLNPTKKTIWPWQ